MHRTLARIAAAFASAAVLTLAAATAAPADPAVTPPANSVVGFNTPQSKGLFDQLAADYNAYLAGRGDTTSPRVYLWDSYVSGPLIVVPKVGGPAITRPNDEQLQKALEYNWHDTVDFVVATHGRDATAFTDHDFIQLGRSAVTWAAPTTGANAPANLTTADLIGIYTCTKQTWDQITDIPNYTGPYRVPIHAYLPQVGAETRDQFLLALGSSGVPLTPGGCVQAATPAPDEGTDPVFQDPNAVVPYNASHYVAQVYNDHGTAADAPGLLSLRNTDGYLPVSAALHQVNPGFAATRYGMQVDVVVRHSDWTSGPFNLPAVFGPGTTGGWTCVNATARADLISWGVVPVASTLCGKPA
ncbi:hypothetical protein AB0K51_30610 [Kitasatospora sp. NPDC049285]|uniref:hypothetical protein n=1 Tax=Kitasatospora sp. NPDC049285 TaxID=3157096 RepID=UPI0034192B67